MKKNDHLLFQNISERSFLNIYFEDTFAAKRNKVVNSSFYFALILRALRKSENGPLNLIQTNLIETIKMTKKTIY